MSVKASVHFLVIWCALFAGTSVGEAADNDRGARSGFDLKALTIKKASLMPAGGGGFEIAAALSGGGGMDFGALSSNTGIQMTGSDSPLQGPADEPGRRTQ